MNSFNHSLKHLDVALSASIDVDGRSYLYFAGTAYLGIPQNERFMDYYLEGLKRFGLNNGTSRNNNIQLGVYEAAENYAAELFGSEAALITSCGYLAAQLTVKHFSLAGSVLYAPKSHPALWLSDAPKNELSFEEWAQNTVEQINDAEQKSWVLISNSVDNLYPEQYDFSFIRQLNSDKRIILIIDDSHGIGVLGHGKGVFCQVPELTNVELVVVASMAKALGVDAGLILGSVKAIEELKRTNEFLGASPPAAAGLFAFMNAGDIYREELEKLKALDHYFTRTLDWQWRHLSGFPVFFNAEENIADRLQEKGILISSFAYPDQDSKAINRVVLSRHTQKDLDQLIAALASL